MKVYIPPIKSQGIKTKLVPWIYSIIPSDFDGVWIEPFMGTGVVGFNLAPRKAIMSDINPHLITFYKSIQDDFLTPERVKSYLELEGAKLLDAGESHYYLIRERFNKHYNPLDFLFLNRSGFNGMIRFNRKGKFNIPFCKKPNRFAKAYITKIVNQVTYIYHLLKRKDFTFVCQSFEDVIRSSSDKDLIYCDPPYIDRHTDYYNGWDDEQERKLYHALSKTDSKFVLSTWHHNKYRDNRYISEMWNTFNISTKEHFYHIGGKEKNRNSIIEALITNYHIKIKELNYNEEQKAPTLFDNIESAFYS